MNSSHPSSGFPLSGTEFHLKTCNEENNFPCTQMLAVKMRPLRYRSFSTTNLFSVIYKAVYDDKPWEFGLSKA